jgi:hypothetical protein
MHRIDNSSTATTLPTPSTPGTPGYFTGGNPSSGQPATVVAADWMNSVQEEISHVIESAGITLSKTANNQLLLALQALAQSPLGFTPVQQGGGVSQLTDKIKIGYDGASVRVTVDTTDEGRIAFLDRAVAFAVLQTFAAGLTANGVITAAAGLTSDGLITAAAGLTSNAAIASTAGDITAESGRLRAGVASTGDANAATILSEFPFANQGGGNTYAKLPSGLIIQMGFVNAPWSGALTGSVWNLPLAFPNAFINCFANISGYGGGYPIAGITVSAGIVSTSQIGIDVDTTVSHTSPFGVSYFAWGY